MLKFKKIFYCLILIIPLSNNSFGIGNYFNYDNCAKQFASKVYTKPILALNYVDSLIKLKDKESSDTMIGYLYDLKARANHFVYQNTDSVIKYSLIALGYFEKSNYYLGISKTQTLIGKMYQINESYDETIRHFKKALQASSNTIHSKTVSIHIYTDIGVLYTEINQIDSALKYLHKAKKHIVKLENNFSKSHDVNLVNSSLGTAYLKALNYDSSIFYFQKALEDGKIGAKYKKEEYINIIKGLSNSYFYLEQKDSAMRYSLLFYELAKDDNNTFMREQARTSLSDAYLLNNNYKKAYELLAEAYEIKDQKYEEKLKSKTLEVASKYENEALENELKFKEILRKNTEKKSQNRAIVLVILGLILAAALVLLLKYRKRGIILESNNQKLEKLTHEKDILLKEVHHRVKNNLQLVSSILNLQKRRTKDVVSQNILNESSHRIRAMSLIYQNFYKSENIAKVDLENYVQRLCNDLALSAFSDDEVNIDVEMESVNLPSDKVVTLGLLLNELITNSLKYGKDSEGKTKIVISGKRSQNSMEIAVSDNGPGLPENYQNGTGLGNQLIANFTDQLNGKLSHFNKDGAIFVLNLPLA